MSLLNSTHLGSISIQAPTREDVFFQDQVFAMVEKASPDWELGIRTGAFNSETDDATLGDGTTARPDFYHERPEFTPVNIDVRQRKDLRFTYRDQPVKSSPVPNAYTVKVYVQYIEADPELETLPEPQRTEAYDRAIRAGLRR